MESSEDKLPLLTAPKVGTASANETAVLADVFSQTLQSKANTSSENMTLELAQKSPVDNAENPALAILMLYLLLFLLLGAQTALFLWKKKHRRSYELVTLAGLWLMPVVISVVFHYWRFVTIWCMYTLITGHLLVLCMSKPVASSTPRKVYSWFLGVYWVSRGLGVAGYILLLTEMLGLGPFYELFLPKGSSLFILWYGVYYGILGRDCAEVASDRIATVMGSGKRLLAQVNNCGVCGSELHDYSHMGEEPGGERAVQLACKHSFHDLCIRGWTIVGKKDSCPVCLEKVDMQHLYGDRPWETRNLNWIQMLDAIRYMVVWNPIILLCFGVVFQFFGPHPHLKPEAAITAEPANITP